MGVAEVLVGIGSFYHNPFCLIQLIRLQSVAGAAQQRMPQAETEATRYFQRPHPLVAVGGDAGRRLPPKTATMAALVVVVAANKFLEADLVEQETRRRQIHLREIVGGLQIAAVVMDLVVGEELLRWDRVVLAIILETAGMDLLHQSQGLLLQDAVVVGVGLAIAGQVVVDLGEQAVPVGEETAGQAEIMEIMAHQARGAAEADLEN